MDEQEDWMIRPIRHGLLPAFALNSTDYDLEDFVLMCEALDVEGENQLRLKAAVAAQPKGR